MAKLPIPIIIQERRNAYQEIIEGEKKHEKAKSGCHWFRIHFRCTFKIVSKSSGCRDLCSM
jgi:hypothetical protein